MVYLEYLSQEDKELIGHIVDCYLLSYRDMKENIHSIYNSPGVWLHSIFNDYKESDNKCLISLADKDGELVASFYIKNSKDSNHFFQMLNLKKAEFISRATFVESLYNAKLIFFEEDKECEMHLFNEVTEEKRENLKKEGFSFYSEIIKSESLYSFIKRYYWSRIIPSSSLIKYRQSGFLTPEQKRHHRDLSLSTFGIVTAILIAMLSPWLMTKYSNTTIDQRQIESIIKAIPTRVEEVKINQNQLDSLYKVIDKSTNKIHGKTTNEEP